jgi:four helix bundle protein
VLLTQFVVAKVFQDLDAWRLAMEVKREIFRLTETGPIAQDLEFRRQIRSAAASAPRNIAEGFGRYRPAEFANKTRIALGELNETASSVIDARSASISPRRIPSASWSSFGELRRSRADCIRISTLARAHERSRTVNDER